MRFQNLRYFVLDDCFVRTIAFHWLGVSEALLNLLCNFCVSTSGATAIFFSSFESSKEFKFSRKEKIKFVTDSEFSTCIFQVQDGRTNPPSRRLSLAIYPFGMPQNILVNLIVFIKAALVRVGHSINLQGPGVPRWFGRYRNLK